MESKNETIVTGNIFKKLIDNKNNLWEKKSFWTKACDVEFDDGSTLEGKVGSLTNDLHTLADNVGGYSLKVMPISDYNALSVKEPNVLYFCY